MSLKIKMTQAQMITNIAAFYQTVLVTHMQLLQVQILQVINNFMHEFVTFNKSIDHLSDVKAQFHINAISTVNSCYSDKNECCARMSGTTDDDNNDSDITFFSESNDTNLSSFNENLANWAISFNISLSATTHLLQILKPLVPSVPKDARTCSFKKISDNVFPIAIFCSSSKPNPLTAYLKDFIAELKCLEKSPFEDNNGHKYIIKLDAVICDVPARAFLSDDSCERYIQKGEWYGKILQPDLSAPLRTDESFRMQADKKHHIENMISPFLELSFGMVSSFPLDYMHLVCLGVDRRMINQWVHGSKKKQCLSKTLLTTLSEKLVLFKQHVPKEFSRKPRSIWEFKRWKATELRQFLLYTGPVVLKGILPNDVYINFSDLSVAVYILLSPSLCANHRDYVKKLLTYFVATFCKLYGKDQCVYNIHSLNHLPDDANHYGALDKVSSFPYESYLGRLKKLVRRPQFLCFQIVRSIFEGHLNPTNPICNENKSVFKKLHTEGPVPISYCHCLQFKKYNSAKFFASINDCFKVNGKVASAMKLILFFKSMKFYNHFLQIQ
ncbi:uncharacterized protein LOC124812158 [Hydra vulgaris]|uniref:uncharacterized protein LOC124812158 n=1 Tax=Hydra vulgaris TaxID=6087 RepID=UPI001F5ECA27|nr:uncharacterized protein LOC124812158 [Hydra vulgaris]